MTQETETAPAYRWVVVASITGCVGMTLTALFTLGLLLPDISRDLGLSLSQQGWLASSVIFGNLALAIPINLLLSRFKPWRIASLSFLLVGLFTLMQGWSPVLAVLIIGRIATGLAFMASQAPRALIIQQWTPREKLTQTNGVLYGTIDVIMGSAFFAVPPLMAWLDGWRNTVYVMGAVSLSLTAVWMVLGRERVTLEYQSRMKSQTGTPLSTLLRYPQLWVMGASMVSAIIGQTAFQTFWPTFAQNDMGISPFITGVVLGLMSFVAAPIDIGVNTVPWLVKRQPLVMATCGIMITGTFLALLYTDNTSLVILLGVLKGTTSAFFPILMIMVYRLPAIRPREVALGLAFMQVCIWVGSGIGPLIVGFISEATDDLRLALLVTAFTPLIMVFTAALLQMREWPAPQSTPALETSGTEA